MMMKVPTKIYWKDREMYESKKNWGITQKNLQNY